MGDIPSLLLTDSLIMFGHRKVKNSTSNSELFDLCQLPDGEEVIWAKVRSWIDINKDNTVKFIEAATFQGDYNDTTLQTSLHLLIRLRHPPPIDVVETLIQHAPKILQLRNSQGNLPLHTACIFHFRSPDVEFIRILVKAYPEGAAVTNIEGWLPLHCACWNDASLEVLNVLLEAYPEGIHVGSQDGKPSRVLRDEWENQLEEDNDEHLMNDKKHMLLLHKASAGGFSVSLVKLLLEASPESCMIRDENGRNPLHHACANNEANSVSIIIYLLHASSESSLVADNHGRTPSPSKLFQEAASCKDSRGMLLLHRQAASVEGVDENTLQFIFRAYPEGVALPDKHGMLPFHHACINQASSLEALMQFVKLYPECTLVNR